MTLSTDKKNSHQIAMAILCYSIKNFTGHAVRRHLHATSRHHETIRRATFLRCETIRPTCRCVERHRRLSIRHSYEVNSRAATPCCGMS